MNLVFTGFMGTGKSAVGKEVAERLGFSFYDTDAFIEENAQMSISSIFGELGEEVFRQMEAEAVEALSEKDSVVISCGGGVVLNVKNIENLAKSGIIINLFASPEQIFERIKGDACRPLLKCGDPMVQIKKLLSERKEAYMNCDFAFDTDNLSVKQVADIILSDSSIVKLLEKGKHNEIKKD